MHVLLNGKNEAAGNTWNYVKNSWNFAFSATINGMNIRVCTALDHNKTSVYVITVVDKTEEVLIGIDQPKDLGSISRSRGLKTSIKLPKQETGLSFDNHLIQKKTNKRKTNSSQHNEKSLKRKQTH